MQRNCPTRDVDLYGEYATEIREDREEPILLPVNRLDDIPEVSDQAQTLCAESRAFDNTDSNTFAIILGASNARRMSVLDKDVVNASVSGATLSNIGQTIDKAHESLKNDAQVEKVVICLGTNDVSQNKSDPEQVILNLTSAINETKKEFPVAEIGLCGIIPRKGRSERVKNFNGITESVNKFARKLCSRDEGCTYIDTPSLFVNADNGHLVVALYDPNDPSGLHINQEGASKLYSKILSFIKTPQQSCHRTTDDVGTPKGRKRNISQSTPPSTEKQAPKCPNQELQRPRFLKESL
ncbi:hypothetical protein FSP39_008206 [Pinctada imbricata]|uniref:SGNH hydrolase-type esterase domain-containing protein n=1 Tax=Pinctada imbricata TaxID=66713 RepID=A0AA88YBP2_PINIB|nr:hypothetical protein FSP39_008206 [Pinctada imbricata]